jgi:hypothetical protein
VDGDVASVPLYREVEGLEQEPVAVEAPLDRLFAAEGFTGR